MRVTLKHLVWTSIGLVVLAGLLFQFGADWSFWMMPLSAVLGIWIGYLTR